MTDFLLRSGISSKDHDVELFQNVGESLLQGMSNSLIMSSTKASLERGQGDGLLDESENDDSVAEAERKAVLIIICLALIFIEMTSTLH